MPSLLDTVISSKLKCAGSFDLCFELLVIIYLDLFEIFKGLIGSNFVSIIMFSCATYQIIYETKFNY